MIDPKQSITKFNRRFFFGRGASAVVGSAAVLQSASMVMGGAGKEPNPFAYDVKRFTRTDPKLLKYEEAARFTAVDPEPNRVAVGPNGRLLVSGKQGVTVLSNSGEKLNEISLSEPARCAAVAEEGTIYVGLRQHIEVFDAKGNRVSSWEPLSGKTWITGLVTDSDHVFAADSGNRVIWRYNKSGKVEGRIGEKDNDRNVPGIILPSPYLDVDLGADGLLRVNNPGRHCVEAYTIGGDRELSWGKPGIGIETFCGCCNPIGLSVLRDGRYVTCEKGIPRVKVYSAEGSFECVVAGPESFPGNAEKGAMLNKSQGRFGGMDAAVDAEGKIYILDTMAARILVMKPKASALAPHG